MWWEVFKGGAPLCAGYRVSCLLLSPRQVPHRFGLGALTQYTWVYSRGTVTGVVVVGLEEPKLTELLWSLPCLVDFPSSQLWNHALDPYTTSTMLNTAVP